MERLRRLSYRNFIEALCNNPLTIPTFNKEYGIASVHSFSFFSFPPPLQHGACVRYFSLSFSILAVFFLMAACHLPCRRPLAWLIHLQRHPVFRFAPCSLDAFADAIGVLATRFRTIFRRLLSSGHRLCLSGWVVVAALVGSPCWIVLAYLN